MRLLRRLGPVAVALVVSVLVSLTALVAPGAPQTGAANAAAAASPGCPQLRPSPRWYGDNRRALQRTIDRRGRCGWDGAPPEQRPYAVFDWDNTVIKNDISDQTIFWMLRHSRILQPPRRDWHATSRYMTDAGATALRRACGRLAEPGEPLPTATNTRCADEILSVRTEEETTGGDPVFRGYHHRRMEAAYAWVGQILQGYTRAQVRRIAGNARDAALAAPKGATWRVGSSRQTAWIRYYPEIRNLVATLQRAGIEPWVVSASPKEFADVWSPAVGIDRAHTIGVAQLVDDNGVLTGHLEGCGGIADGADSIMTYVDGKRCFINERIVGIEGRAALDPAPRPLRPVISGGDANTDVSMLKDATGVHLVLNRNGAEVMCNAYDDADGRWAINPMFIQPLPRLRGGYPCSTTGYVDDRGRERPVRRADGTIIPDQRDRVHG